jgi:hypothetical protein
MVFVKTVPDLRTGEHNAAISAISSIFDLDSEDGLKDATFAKRVPD